MEILTDYLIFLLKVFTIALAITVPLLMVIGSSKGKSQAKGKLSITNLSVKFEEMGNAVKGSVMNPKELKKFNKENLKDKKKKDKGKENNKDTDSVFVLNFKGDISDNVLNLAEKSIKSGVDGLVCSGDEINLIRKNFGDDVEILVPGVRFNTQLNDQSRVISPRDAIDLGANYIVLGRTITDSPDMKKQLDDIIKTLD